jgi:hypothetical protein
METDDIEKMKIDNGVAPEHCGICAGDLDASLKRQLVLVIGNPIQSERHYVNLCAECFKEELSLMRVRASLAFKLRSMNNAVTVAQRDNPKANSATPDSAGETGKQ